MSIEIIGKRIASMRKEKGIKQEELAKYVGVSNQAVSKWENGGVPDTELLPKIADFFSVSVDSLFGRNITDYSDMRSALMKKINESTNEKVFKEVFNYCWDIERAMMSDLNLIEDGSVEEYEKNITEDAQHYSSVMTDYGFTRMGLANRLQYFLIVPEPKDTEAALFNGIDYPAFFKDFSDPDVFNTCVMLHKRHHKKLFTSNLLVKNMGITLEKATEVLKLLKKYHLVYPSQIEMDDEIQTVYQFSPTPSFVAFLIFAREMIDKPGVFCYYNEGRGKPYLK